MLHAICVYCGSSPGRRESYARAAEALGRCLVERGLRLVYGGARVGLMGVVADTVLAGGGEVVGVMPEALMAREVTHDGLTELRVVGSMHERKALMVDLADGFVALPGGLGTLDELFEVLTWAQIGLHRKPCGLLDVDGYYEPLAAQIARAAADGFVPPSHRSLLLTDPDPGALLDAFARYQPPPLPKWIDRDSA